jgi:hypothetical protein
MRIKPLLLTSIMLVCSIHALAQRTKPETKIILQPNSPVRIMSFNAMYFSGSSTYVSRGIHNELEFENVSPRNIVAIEFGLVAFDIWNEFLDRTGGITMSGLAAGVKDKGKWVASRYADFSFHTGVAYVSKVRFDDGEIWTADNAGILLEMRKIQKDFDASKLKKKPNEEP